MLFSYFVCRLLQVWPLFFKTRCGESTQSSMLYQKSTTCCWIFFFFFVNSFKLLNLNLYASPSSLFQRHICNIIRFEYVVMIAQKKRICYDYETSKENCMFLWHADNTTWSHYIDIQTNEQSLCLLTIYNPKIYFVKQKKIYILVSQMKRIRIYNISSYESWVCW